MNRSMLTGVVIGVAVAAGDASIAGLGCATCANRYAAVLDVKPVGHTVRMPREAGADVPVGKQRPLKDEHQIAGAATAQRRAVEDAQREAIGYDVPCQLGDTVAGAAPNG